MEYVKEKKRKDIEYGVRIINIIHTHTHTHTPIPNSFNEKQIIGLTF